MRGGFSLKSSKNSLLAWTGHSPWTACPRLSWVMASVSAELVTRRRWKPFFPQLSTPAFDAEIPDPASSGTGWNPEVLRPSFCHTAITAATFIQQTLRVSCERGLTKLIKLKSELSTAISLYCRLLKGNEENNSIWKPTAAVTASWFLVLPIKLVTTFWC